MFLPVGENGGFVEGGTIRSSVGHGFGLSLGLVTGAFEVGITGNSVGEGANQVGFRGIVGTVDVSRLRGVNPPVTLQFSGCMMADDGLVLGCGPTLYVTSADSDGWMINGHCRVTFLKPMDFAATSEYPADLGLSLGKLSNRLIVALRFGAVFYNPVTTYSISLSFGSRGKHVQTYDDNF